MHFGLEQYVPWVLYLSATAAFLLSLFWRPQVGLYFLVPLLPLQTIRYRLMDMPLGNKLIDILLLGVIPFSYFLERLVIGATNVYRQIAWFAAIFALMTAGLWFHPAFRISG